MDAFDEFVELFESLGLSPQAARVAAAGRGEGGRPASEAQARAEWREDEAAALAHSVRTRHLELDQSVSHRERTVLTDLGAGLAGLQEDVDRLRASVGLPASSTPAVSASSPAEARDLPVGEVVDAARQHLRMSEAEARELATRLWDREVTRAGVGHAVSFLRTFAAGLRTPVREVART